MNLADRNKIIIGAVAIVVVAIVAAVFLSRRGRGRGAAPADTAADTTTTAAQPAGTEAAPGAESATGETVEGQPTSAAGEEAAAAVVAQAPALGLVRMGIGSAEPSRPDPMLTFEPPPQPTPPELKISLPPTTLYPGGIRPQPSDEPRIAGRRVAGVLFNDQAWGILEDEQGSFIVKPGDVVDGVRITAIARDAILIVDEDGKRWSVSLRGLGPSARTAASSTTVSGMPARPTASP
jgi:hypothetical protein